MWAIGSQPGYDDIMAFTREESDCGENSRNNPLSLMEGHAYYISVKVRYFYITFTVKKLIDNFILLNIFPNNISTKEKREREKYQLLNLCGFLGNFYLTLHHIIL